jgi:UDP-N-acetylmuramoyl-tripeptide--D-alanyl-D-alanine ligase
MKCTASTLARGCRGQLRAEGAPGRVCTDTRNLGDGDWFLALVGDRFDGHDYLEMAREKGCAGVIAQRVPAGWDRGFVEVADTLVALQDLARCIRRDFGGPVVGITGSAGKTTTRALTSLALAPLGRVHDTKGNLNNHIGVPLTLLDAPPEADAWVVEMGMNAFGEIALLQDIAAPTVRLITNVGAAHLEGVGSLDGVARAKGELFAGARPNDLCVINHDDLRIRTLPLPPGVRSLTFGTAATCAVRLVRAEVDADTLQTHLCIQTPAGPVETTLSSPGVHLAWCALSAVAVAVGLNLPLTGLADRLASYSPVGMRQRVEAGPGGLKIINDAYNANPLSTAAALRTLGAITGRSRVALLGDMLELGADEVRAHRDTLALALDLGLDLIGLVGPRYAAAAAHLGVTDQVVSAPTAADLATVLAPRLHAGDIVLLKGSRGLAMERVLPPLFDLLPAPSHAED